MEATASQREAFGRALRDLRRQRGFTSAEKLARALERLGVEITASAVRYWENGINEPDRPKLDALEQVLQVDGDLVAILGKSEDPHTARRRGEVVSELVERVDDIERRLAALERGATGKPQRHLGLAAASGVDPEKPEPTKPGRRPSPPAGADDHHPS